ncbi:MAG: hypothetical protein AAF564_04415 [Bacteroidota bacterium]
MRTLAIVSFLLLASCTAREEIVVSDLTLMHRGWDTLVVNVDFASQTVLGGIQPVDETNKWIVAFNASYDTLYAGEETVFGIPDIDLGNEEQVLVEVCGDVKLLRVCEQAIVAASPKRVSLEPDITYPLRKKVFEGAYKLPFIVERLGQDTSWQKINPSGALHGYLEAYVQGRKETAIQLPFSKSRGGFNLAYKQNYKDFKFYLDSALLDDKSANVIFDVYVDLEGFTDAVATTAKEILVKTEDEHKQDIALFVEQAADKLVDRLSPFLRRKRNTVYIDSWAYNTFEKAYTVDMEVEWKGALFNRSTYSIKGILEVSESGEEATFQYVDGNKRARQRWNSRVNGDVMDLMPQGEVAVASLPAGRGAFDAQKGRVVIEAEHFDGERSYNNQRWTVQRDRSGYTGQGAIVVSPDRGVRIRSRYNKRSPEVTYPVYFEDPGRYYIWMRVWADNNNSNSVHLGINGAANRSSSYIGTDTYRTWVWTQQRQDSDDAARIDVPSAGMKELNVWMREDGFYIDRIILTKDRNYRPEGSGPPESSR